MSESQNVFVSKRREGVVGAVSAGCFLILVGLIFATTPNLFGSILDFFQNFGIVTVPNTDIPLPAPETPSAHAVVYSAVGLFSLIWWILEIVFLALRFIIRSPFDKKAENASNIVFWLGAYYLISTMLTATTTRTVWFVFWTEIIMLIGVVLIVRAIILAFKRQPA
ncbi:hypothetical protein HXY33_04800 [Candidatus Bathyarchaeota archaeon]|nr:hypothetical protein [Candidatus Bathyarchaeota archaeon]